jgi:hypothetical protein
MQDLLTLATENGFALVFFAKFPARLGVSIPAPAPAPAPAVLNQDGSFM